MKYRAFRKLIQRENSYLHKTGWMKSLCDGVPVNCDGDFLPWMNYPVVRLLEERLNKNIILFEYGSGYSTFFYAKLVAEVVSVEYDQNWYEKIHSKIPNNAQLIYREKDVDGQYCKSIHTTEKKYNVVIVDGRDRVNCVKQSLDALTEDGVVILDDSQRERYQDAIMYAGKFGYKALNFEGIKPTDFGVNCTTILYREDNCLGI